MTELRVGGWSTARWGQYHYGVNFEAASAVLKGSSHVVGAVHLAPARFHGKRWLQWEASSGAIAFNEIWAGDKDLTDSAVCMKLGDDRSGDIKAVSVVDESSSEPNGPLRVVVSVLFEDGSIALLKIRTKVFGESILRDLVQFKEGELIDLKSDGYASAHAPLRQYWFQLSNMPPSGVLAAGSWVSGSALDLTVTFGEGVHYCLYARINLRRSGWSGGDDAASDTEDDSCSLDEWVLRDQTPFQEIISGWIGAKESPQVLAVGGVSKALNRFDRGRAVAASLSADGSVALWDVEARRPMLHVPSALFSRSPNGQLEAMYNAVEEARVSVISGEKHYDVLVAASSSKNRLLEWRVALFRVYQSNDRSRSPALTHDVLYLTAPGNHLSVYATLVDICPSSDGRTVCSVWRDGLKEREFLVTHTVPDLAQSRQWSNWIADPAVQAAGDAPMRCVARTTPCSEVLCSSDYAMTPLDGRGLDGRLCAPPAAAALEQGGERARLVKRLGGSSDEGLSGLLKSLGYSATKSIETLHAMMLKRIFSPGTFTGSVIKSVLVNDVPAAVRVAESVPLSRAVDGMDSNPQILGGFVAAACLRWAQLLAGAAEQGDMQLDTSYVVSMSNDSEYASVTRLETAYSNFFKFCAKKTFEYQFCRRGSLVVSAGPQNRSVVSVARRGGLLGLLCDVPNASARFAQLESEGIAEDAALLCASRLCGAFHRLSHRRGPGGELRRGLDDITSRLSVFMEHVHDYSPSNTAWISEAFVKLSASVSNADLRDLIPVTASCLADSPSAVLEALLDTSAGRGRPVTVAGRAEGALGGAAGSLLLDALMLSLKASFEHLETVCLALASILSNPAFPSSLPAGVVDAISLVYFPRAVTELLRVGFLLWASTVQLEEPTEALSKLGRVDIADLQPRMAASAAHYQTSGRPVVLALPSAYESRIYGLMGSLMHHVGGSLDLHSTAFWDRFDSVCVRSVFQLNTPYSVFVGALADAKAYSVMARAASLCRAFSALRCAQDQFVASAAPVTTAGFTLGRQAAPQGLSWLRTLSERVTDVQATMFHIQCQIMKELRTVLSSAKNGPSRPAVDRVLRLAEDLFQCTDLNLALFVSGRPTADALIDAVATSDPKGLLSQRDAISGDEMSDISLWLETNLAGSDVSPANLVNIAEGFYSMARLPCLQLWLRNIKCAGESTGMSERLSVLVENFPSVVAACFMMHWKAISMTFIERVRWLLDSSEVRSAVALKGSLSCIGGIAAVTESLCAFDSGTEFMEASDDKISNLVAATLKLLLSDTADALSGSFANAMEGCYFDEALSVVLQLKEFGREDSRAARPGPSGGEMEVVEEGAGDAALSSRAVSAPGLLWKASLRSLVCRVCESGHLGWLCGLPNIYAGIADISEAILVELENLACGTEIGAFQANRADGSPFSQAYGGNYYECLTAFQLSRFDYHGAARAMNSLVTELEALPRTDFGVQACFLAAASQALQMLPPAEQFVIQRPPVVSSSLSAEAAERAAHAGVDAQSMISLVSVPSLCQRGAEALGAARCIEEPRAEADGILSSTSDIIRGLCSRYMFHEALSVAYRCTALTSAGVGADGLEPLSAPVSSVAVSEDTGLGLFVHLLAKRCCEAGADSGCERSLPPGSSASTGHLGHVTSPLALWDSAGAEFKYDTTKNNYLWSYLAAILRTFDGPHMENWGLHKVAVLACLAARPGKKLPEVIVRSYCGDLLVPIQGERGQGNGMGLLRTLYDHGHLLEACDLSTRIINDSIDPRNKTARKNSAECNSSLEPLIPFAFLDKLIGAVDRAHDAVSGAASAPGSEGHRSRALAVLLRSQGLLKQAIEIMVKVNLINSYNRN